MLDQSGSVSLIWRFGVRFFEKQPDVLCLSETWLADNEEARIYRLPYYNEFDLFNGDTHAGGVMVPCKRGLFFNS